MKCLYLLVTFLFMLSVPVISSSADTDDENNRKITTESNASFNFYAAYDVNYWSIIPSIYQEIDYKNDPYNVKQVGIRIGLSFVYLGIEYSNTTLSINDNPVFGKEDKNTSHFAEMMKFFNEMRFGHFFLYLEASHQEYYTTAKSDQPDKMYYYRKNDGLLELDQGDEFKWATEYTKYNMEGGYIFKNSSTMSLGVSYMEFDAPTELQISMVNSPESGRVILFTENKIIDIHFSGKIRQKLGNNVYSLFSISGSILTFFYPQSSYFDIKYNNPLSFDSFSVSGVYSAGYSINFTGSNYRIETGAGADYSSASLSYNKCTVKEDMITSDPLGNPYIFNAGEKVDLDFDRSEIFWGYYIKGSVFF